MSSFLFFVLFYSFFFNLDRRFQLNKHAMNISNTSTDQGLLRSRESPLLLSRGCIAVVSNNMKDRKGCIQE